MPTDLQFPVRASIVPLLPRILARFTHAGVVLNKGQHHPVLPLVASVPDQSTISVCRLNKQAKGFHKLVFWRQQPHLPRFHHSGFDTCNQCSSSCPAPSVSVNEMSHGSIGPHVPITFKSSRLVLHISKKVSILISIGGSKRKQS